MAKTKSAKDRIKGKAKAVKAKVKAKVKTPAAIVAALLGVVLAGCSTANCPTGRSFLKRIARFTGTLFVNASCAETHPPYKCPFTMRPIFQPTFSRADTLARSANVARTVMGFSIQGVRK